MKNIRIFSRVDYFLLVLSGAYWFEQCPRLLSPVLYPWAIITFTIFLWILSGVPTSPTIVGAFIKLQVHNFLAVLTGHDPATSWSTIKCSSNWATTPYLWMIKEVIWYFPFPLQRSWLLIMLNLRIIPLFDQCGGIWTPDTLADAAPQTRWHSQTCRHTVKFLGWCFQQHHLICR